MNMCRKQVLFRGRCRLQLSSSRTSITAVRRTGRRRHLLLPQDHGWPAAVGMVMCWRRVLFRGLQLISSSTSIAAVRQTGRRQHLLLPRDHGRPAAVRMVMCRKGVPVSRSGRSQTNIASVSAVRPTGRWQQVLLPTNILGLSVWDHGRPAAVGQISSQEPLLGSRG